MYVSQAHLICIFKTQVTDYVKTFLRFLNHNIIRGLDIVQTPLEPHAVCQSKTTMTDGRWKEAPKGKALMSQFHCNNGARALGIVAIVRSHSAHQLTRKKKK